LICFQPDYMRFVEKSPRFRFFLVCSFFAPAARWVVLSVRVISRDLFLRAAAGGTNKTRVISLSPRSTAVQSDALSLLRERQAAEASELAFRARMGDQREA
jgi:hypothetical protein